MIQKISKDFHITDITKKWFKLKIYLWLAIIMCIASTMGYSYQTFFTTASKTDTVEVIIIDTFDVNKIDTFMVKAKCTPENVLILMHKLDFTHPYESCAQMMFESTDKGIAFNSNVAKTYNNLGGYGGPKPLYFNHWTECIRFAKKYQIRKGLKKGMNFYQWLNGVSYHDDDNDHYNSNTLQIAMSLRQKYPLKQILLKLNERK